MFKSFDRIDRRRFLKNASISAFVLAAHRHSAWAQVTSPGAGELPAPADPRIRSLRLRTAAPLGQLKAFYGEQLGLAIPAQGADEITVAGGRTPITFVKVPPDQGEPFYHFAFNIPENKVREAYAWQLERSELIPSLPNLRDPAYPENVIHFRHWNAHSVFFFDPAGNVVEYIGRHDLPNASDGPFTRDDILYASEIAFIVDDVPTTARGIEREFELAQYAGASEAFHAVGDEEGLLLVFRRGRHLGLGSDRPRNADIFPTEAAIRAAPKRRHDVRDFPYVITSS